ncbi:MAG: alpha/beta hydrolase-fold protein [Bacteroidales bacterium]
MKTPISSKRFFIFLAILGLHITLVSAQNAGYRAFIKISVPSFKNTFLGEPEQQSVYVYLPPSYSLDTTRRFPVVYFLSGYGVPITSLNFMDILIATGKVKEMIIVSPSSTSKLVGSFYVNSPVTGNWDDYISRDLISYIDTNYRTIPKPEARALAGHSMGGFGALNLSMLHPDVFCIGYGISPGLYNENGLQTSQVLTSRAKSNYFTFIDSVKDLSSEEAHQQYLTFINKMKNNGDDIFSVAYGSAFSGDTNLKAPYINFPYMRTDSGEIIDSVYLDRYDNGFGNLKEKAAIYKDNLEQLKGYVIDYGTADEYAWLSKGCAYFDTVLTNAGISHQCNAFAGNHSNQLTKRMTDFMLPFCSSHLEFDTAHFNNEATIYGIKITGQSGDAVIDTLERTVHAKVTAMVAQVRPAIYISPGATINPPSDVYTDYSSGSVNYTITSEDGSKSEEWTVYISRETYVREEIGSEEIRVFPNPARDHIRIQPDEGLHSIVIYDLSGRPVLERIPYVPGNEIKISDLRPGFYILKAFGIETNQIIRFAIEGE